MKKRIVNGQVLKVGDRIRIIYAGMGARGANGKVGTVVKNFGIGREGEVSGLAIWMGGLMVKLDEPTGFANKKYWRVSDSGRYELLSPTRLREKKHFDSDVAIKCNEAYGVILAIARAYKLDNDKVNAIVDALYGDNKTLEDYDTFEILDELRSRVED